MNVKQNRYKTTIYRIVIRRHSGRSYKAWKGFYSSCLSDRMNKTICESPVKWESRYLLLRDSFEPASELQVHWTTFIFDAFQLILFSFYISKLKLFLNLCSGFGVLLENFAYFEYCFSKIVVVFNTIIFERRDIIRDVVYKILMKWILEHSV